jgi:uncharacterized protein (DUF2461 family)
MDAKRILKFLRQLMANNNRPWFQAHRQEYEAINTWCLTLCAQGNCEIVRFPQKSLVVS